LPIHDHCPSQIEFGVQWPTTAKESVARQSCPGTQTGLATRTCSAEGRWFEVNSFNCTRPEYSIMVSKYDVLNSVELLMMLHNATRGSDAIEGRNLDIARTALHRILDIELGLDQLKQNHLKDLWFTESLVVAAGKVAAYESSEDYLATIRKLTHYGSAVFSIHKQLSYLQPFQFSSEHIVFSVDELDFSNDLPKYNNFVDHRPDGFPMVSIHVRNATRPDKYEKCARFPTSSEGNQAGPKVQLQTSRLDVAYAVDVVLACESKGELEREVQAWCDRLFGLKLNVKKTEYLTTDVNESCSIKINGTELARTSVFKYLGSAVASDDGLMVEVNSSAFYTILPHPRCAHCETPLVAVFANSTEPIRVVFELDERTGWRYPECVHLDDKYSTWSTQHAHLVGLNLTHAVCEFSSNGILTLLAKADSGAFVRISHSASLAAPVMAAVALLLCLVAALLTIVRKTSTARFIRLGFILTFVLNAANLYFLNRAALNQAYCPVRNAVLSFCSCAPFAWLLLSSLHLYRMLSERPVQHSSASLCLLLGVVLPGVLSVATFALTSYCSIDPQLWLFWMILLPITLLLLLSFYASATSLLVSMNKQFDVVVVKLHLRRAICQHFLLGLLTTMHTTVAVLAPLFDISNPLKLWESGLVFAIGVGKYIYFAFQEFICNITLVVAALFILIWSAYPAGKDSPNTTTTMWLDASQKSNNMAESMAVGCESPLLPEDSTAEQWMPEAIPSDPFLTSTPVRDLIDMRDRENPVVNAILSPADKILSDGLGHVYGNMGTLTRFRTEEDDADDAYYTYTSKRYKQSTFSGRN
uniref:G_PROTEIN_RECEP_F2_3 domain-containing protein n=1 Tax=Heligmosomoides polygyrus TaxID=6339 RepID=A0A8L8KDJ5_HELPZ